MAVRVTRTIAEVAGTVTPSIRITRTMAEVAGTVAQPDLRLFRYALMVLLDIADGIEKTAQNTVTFSDSETLSRPVSMSQTVTFSEVIVLVSKLSPELAQTITFSQTANNVVTLNEAASDTLTFSESAINSLLTPEVDQTVTFSDQANETGAQSFSESDTVTFSQVLAAIFPLNVFQTVTFSQGGGAGVIIGGGISRNAIPDTVTFSQSDQKVLIKGSATSLTGTTGTVTFSQDALLPKDFSIPQSFVLTDVALSSLVYNIAQTVTFTSPEPIPVSTRSPTITQTLSFGHALAFINKIDLCGYSPDIGTNTDPLAPAPPPASLTVAKQSTITLSWPTTSPTETVTIRAPEFGDIHRLNFDRINRESRGGSLQVFADPFWPKQELLEVTFTALKEAEAQSVLDFFQTTLGLEVKLVDWLGRTWHGFVTNPESQLVRSRRNVVDLSFEFEGEQQ